MDISTIISERAQYVWDSAPHVGERHRDTDTTIVAERVTDAEPDGVHSIVLCVRRDNYDPYIVWHRLCGMQSSGPADYCIHGDYYAELAEAIDRFNTRSGYLSTSAGDSLNGDNFTDEDYARTGKA